MRWTRLAITGAALGFAACGGTTTPDPEELASLDVVVSDDPTSKLALSTDPWALFAHHKSFASNYFHGRLTGRLGFEISRNGRDWISLGAPTSVDLPLQVEGERLALQTGVRVPAGSYGYLRLTIGAGETALETGAEIGGETLDAPVALELGDGGGLIVETRLSIPIFLAAGGRVTLAIDLNAEAWVSEENIEAGRIPATDVETAISATPHQVLPAALVPPRRGSV